MTIKKEHEVLARRLCVKAITDYRQRFINEQDLLSGVEREAIVIEIDKILQDVKFDKVGILARQNRELHQRIEHLASLDDCDEEFEM